MAVLCGEHGGDGEVDEHLPVDAVGNKFHAGIIGLHAGCDMRVVERVGFEGDMVGS